MNYPADRFSLPQENHNPPSPDLVPIDGLLDLLLDGDRNNSSSNQDNSNALAEIEQSTPDDKNGVDVDDILDLDRELETEGDLNEIMEGSKPESTKKCTALGLKKFLK